MRKLMLPLLTLLLSLLSVPPVAAQSFTGFLRGLSNTLTGGNNPPAPAPSTTTATIGIRGMDEETAGAGPARPEDLKLIDGWSATKVEAETAARKRGLVANQTIAYDAPPATAPVAEAGQ